MIIIEVIRTSKLKNNTHYEFHISIVNAIDRKPGPVMDLLRLRKWTDPYLVAFGREQSALDIVTKSKFTRRLAKKDRERGEACRWLVAAVKTMLHHSDPAVRDAAEEILDKDAVCF